MSLKHEYLLNPITGLAYHFSENGDRLILAGEGSFLKIYNAQKAQLLHQCEIFNSQAVHGISVRDNVEHGLQIVIWGGSNLVLLTKEDFDLILDQNVSSIANTAISVSDWILDVTISPFDDSSCVLVTAHNTVIRARFDGPNQAPLLEPLHSPSRSILYSAHLTWESPSYIMVAAGTVFGEIVVWQCSPSSRASPTESRVLFTFTGHEGSIFGVDISPPILGQGGVTRLLASCSDDRTIRIWNISATSSSEASRTTAVTARETGFGDNDVDGEGSRHPYSCVAMAMGHASRIWSVKFLGDGSTPIDSSAINVLSFGEDSTTLQWQLAIETDVLAKEGILLESAELNQVGSFAFHSGKHIWSMALQRRDDLKAFVATGGADGKVSQYELKTSESPIHTKIFEADSSIRGNANSKEKIWSGSWDLDEILKTSGLPIYEPESVSKPATEKSPEDALEILKPDGKPKRKQKAKKIPKDTFNRYAFVSENDILVTTTFGRVLLCRIYPSVQWEELTFPESGSADLRSYAVVLGFPELELACLAGANGNIYVCHRGQALLRSGKMEGKIADMFKVCDSRTKSFGLVATSLGGITAMLFDLDLSGPTPQLVERAVYTLPDRFVVTSACRSNDLLMLGSRAGSLAIYTDDQLGAPLEVWKPVESTPGDAITTIALLPSTDNSGSHTQYILTTSRDGLYSIFQITTSQNSIDSASGIAVQQIHQGTPPFGPLIEAGWFEGDKLFLYGFKGKNFVVWDETEQCEITNVECGGSHRSYAYSPVRGSNGGYFAYTKASRMYLHSHEPSSHQIMKSGGHGREIRACAVSGDQKLIATGAEETAIRIWHYDAISNPQTHLKCQAIVQKHSAGIQHLQWHGTRYLFSSGGNEEFYVWAVQQIPGFGVGIICEASCPDPSAERDLRIMSFDLTELPNSNSTDENGAKLLISLAYSDSTIRTYTYSKPESFKLIATGRYTSSCLTQIRHFQLHDDGIVILTAATDGKLVLWKGLFNTLQHDDVSQPTQLAVLSIQKIHQNAIKCLDIVKSSSRILVATGGDDNALGLSVYLLSASMAAILPTCFVLRSAHAAAITGLCFGHDDTVNWKKGITIASSGNDQKVKTWVARTVNDDESNITINIKQLGDVFTPVADIGDVACLGADGKVLIVGNGMEVWKRHE